MVSMGIRGEGTVARRSVRQDQLVLRASSRVRARIPNSRFDFVVGAHGAAGLGSSTPPSGLILIWIRHRQAAVVAPAMEHLLMGGRLLLLLSCQRQGQKKAWTFVQARRASDLGRDTPPSLGAPRAPHRVSGTQGPRSQSSPVEPNTFSG